LEGAVARKLEEVVNHKVRVGNLAGGKRQAALNQVAVRIAAGPMGLLGVGLVLRIGVQPAGSELEALLVQADTQLI